MPRGDLSSLFCVRPPGISSWEYQLVSYCLILPQHQSGAAEVEMMPWIIIIIPHLNMDHDDEDVVLNLLLVMMWMKMMSLF